MENTPASNKIHITLYGDTNAGKSSLFNAFLETDISIVSSEKATTTDPVSKSMELLGVGAVVLTDTAGLNDHTFLGEKRKQKTLNMLMRTDYAIYAADPKDFNKDTYNKMAALFKKKNIPYITVFTKKDMYENEYNGMIKTYDNAIFVSVADKNAMEALKALLSEKLKNLADKENPLISDLLKPESHVVLVIPIDSEAPKGRLILPQVQVMRDLIDSNIYAHVTNLDSLKGLIASLTKIDLVITDSQAFKEVDKIVPKSTPLTSFSILTARQKGDISALIEGIAVVPSLKANDNILICENCTHNKTHEDIGRIKIPNLLKKITGLEFNIDFKSGRDFPEDLSRYKLIIQCGGCMATKREICSRIILAKEANVPITNYGIFLAYGNGILSRSVEIFAK